MKRTPPSTPLLPDFPTVEDRVAESTEIWARDLRALFEHAKDRFGDVTWESEGDERIWGHKAIIYARAPKAFKDRYFISKPFSRSPTSLSGTSTPYLLPPLYHNRPTSPSSSYRASPNVGLGLGSNLSVGSFGESEGTIRATSDGILRLTHGDTPELFRAQLEWLYTGEGFGDVVEWISAEDESGGLLGGSVRDSLGRRGNIHDRRDKLGQDLTYMWRSKLYADVRIHLKPQDSADERDSDSDSSTDSLSSTAIFTSHRLVLASRSPYFASVLLNPSSFKTNSSTDIHLPTPPFTSAALHFCLGWMYAGHLDFSNRNYDLLTAFQIQRAAAYLQLDTLIGEVESRIVHDFCHGLDYQQCHCRKCPARAARVWRFAGASDVGAVALEGRAREWLVQGWGESWGREVGGVGQQERDRLVRSVIGNISMQNLVRSYRNIDMIRGRMEEETRKGRGGDWIDRMEEMVEEIETHVRGILVGDFARVAEGQELWGLVTGRGFSEDVLDRVIQEIVDSVGNVKACTQGPRVYQTLQTVLPARSRARQKIEMAKDGVLGHIKRRWMQIRDEGGFHDLENWSLKEISDEIEVAVEDLLSTPNGIIRPRARASLPTTIRAGIPRTNSRITSLSDAASAKADVASTRSTRSRAKPSPIAPEPSTGLKRLRLSSSASTNSVTSSQSTPAPTPPSRSNLGGPSTLPQARSPTASKPSTVALGGSVRARAAALNRAANNTPSPTQPRAPMTGPPRPLMTGAALVASSRTPNATSTRTNALAPAVSGTNPKARSMTPSVISKAGPSRPTDSTSTTRSIPNKQSTPSIASSRQPTASTSRLPAPSIVPSKPTNPSLSKPSSPSIASTRTTRTSNASSIRTTKTSNLAPSISSVRATRTPRSTAPTTPTKLTPAPTPIRARTSSVATTSSVRSKAPTIATSRPRTSSVSTVASSKTLSQTMSPPPLKKVVPSTISRLRNPSQSTTSSRLRNVSSASNAGSIPPLPPVTSSKSIRSPSGSTDETPEATTPLLSQSQIQSDPIIHRINSTTSLKLSPPKKTTSALPPPVSLNNTRTIPRKTSTSSSMILRPHPASAFDPPKPREFVRHVGSLPKLEVQDGSIPFRGAGVALHIGIPCIVSLASRRARFRANVKYIGQMADSKGPWVGLEVEDLERFEIETLPFGSRDGVHYFHFTVNPPTVDEDEQEARLLRQRKIDLMKMNANEGGARKKAKLSLGLGLETERKRSNSPFVGGEVSAGMENPRALFVRPQEVVFILGAE